MQHWYTQTTLFNPKTSDDDKFEFLIEFWVETYAYWLYPDYLARFDPNLTALTQVWPLDDQIWPPRILNMNSGQNSESKHMYVGYISTNLSDLTLIWRFWPTFDLIWPQKVMIHTSSESQCNFRSFKVYSINIRPLGVAEKSFLDFFHHGRHFSIMNYHVVTFSTAVEIIFFRKLIVYIL